MKTLLTLLLVIPLFSWGQLVYPKYPYPDTPKMFYPLYTNDSMYVVYDDSVKVDLSLFEPIKPQPKWYKITKNDWKLVGGSAAFGSFYAVNQSLVHHHLGRGNQYWDVNVSWKNKYKDFDNGDMSAKFFLSKSVLAPTTDGYHLTQFLYRTAGVVTLAFAIGDFDAYKRKDRWKIIGKKIVLCTLTERLFFNVLFAALGSH